MGQAKSQVGAPLLLPHTTRSALDRLGMDFGNVPPITKAYLMYVS